MRALLDRLTRSSHRHLSPAEARIVEAAADTFFPEGGPIPVSGSEAGAVDYLEGYMDRSDPMQRVLIRLLWRATEMSPLVFGPRRARFTELALRERQQFLQGAFTSAIYFRRVMFISLRALHTMAYFADERVCEAMNMRFDPDPFGLGDVVLEEGPHVPPPARSGERLIDGADVEADADDVQVA